MSEKRREAFAASPPLPRQEQLLLLPQQSLEDQKKARNRLAQRKHRERKFVSLQCADDTAYSFGLSGAKNVSIAETAGEEQDIHDMSQSSSLPRSAWKPTWGSLGQSQSTAPGIEGSNEYKDQLRYKTHCTYV